MKRSLITAIGAAALALPGTAQAQQVTNPAAYPAPTKVTIDGREYSDGLDTLPGYDDEACTPIPNVQYDFESNTIEYYDDGGKLLDSAHWTEWDRISSYDTWKAQQNASTPTPTATAAPTTTSGSSQTTQQAAPQQSSTTQPAATNQSTTTQAATNTGTKSSGSTTRTPSSGSKSTSSGGKTSNRTATSSGAGILVALIAVAGLGLVFRGFARLRGFGRH
jgi:hypothetical protein